MKVVLFCGGLGTRLREYSETIPKPLVNIGPRPIIWNLMKYYAHYGHKEFILCLGYRGDMIKDYFLNYNECLSNDFTMSEGGKKVELANSDIDNWKISFVDTGINSNLGERLMAVKSYLDDEDQFLVNYSDGLSDLDLESYVQHFEEKDAIASFVGVRPSQSFHAMHSDEDGYVNQIERIGASDFWINGGFFVLKKEIFGYMKLGEELVEKPFRRLIDEKKLISYKYSGFWKSMDTFKDKKDYDSLYDKGDMPWCVWND